MTYIIYNLVLFINIEEEQFAQMDSMRHMDHNHNHINLEDLEMMAAHFAVDDDDVDEFAQLRENM